jgi:site-specific DNA-cytosine methylase
MSPPRGKTKRVPKVREQAHAYHPSHVPPLPPKADEGDRTNAIRRRGTLTVAEYFAGIGLVRMGLEPCGWQVVFANDFSPRKYEMYRDFFPDAPKHYAVKDIFRLDPTTIPPTELATCSFPCIDLSLAGNMAGVHGKHSRALGALRTLRSQGDERETQYLSAF